MNHVFATTISVTSQNCHTVTLSTSLSLSLSEAVTMSTTFLIHRAGKQIDRQTAIIS